MVLNEEQWIKELREKRIAYGISQGRLAVASGITREYLNKIESGKMKPSICIFLHGSLHITLLSLLSQFVFPAVVTACICFGLLCNKKNVNETISIVLCILWSVVWWLITANEKIYSVIKMPVWILLLGIALLILGSMIYRVLHDCTRYWEGHSNGFNDN